MHDHVPDHENVVFEDHYFLKVLGNYHNCCGEHIEVIEMVLKCENDFEISEFFVKVGK